MMTSRSAALLAIFILPVSGPVAQARMAPKYERVGLLGAALEHLSTIAGMLELPIEKIDVAGSRVSFVAGKCRVIVTVEDRPQTGPAMPGGGDYVGRVGGMSCD